MGRANGKSYIEEMKIRGREKYEQNGGKRDKILQWKDLPKKVKKKTKKKTA